MPPSMPRSLLCISMEIGERSSSFSLSRSLDVIALLLLSHFPQFVVALPSHAQKLVVARTMMHAARQTVQLRNSSHLGRARANYIQGRDSDRKHRCNFLFERFALCNPKESIVGQASTSYFFSSQSSLVLGRTNFCRSETIFKPH